MTASQVKQEGRRERSDEDELPTKRRRRKRARCNIKRHRCGGCRWHHKGLPKIQ
jgi:hypothetical protein